MDGRRHRSLSPVSAMTFAASGLRPAKLPVLPRFQSGQLPDLTMVRETRPKAPLVFRLSPSGLSIDGSTPVWVG